MVDRYLPTSRQQRQNPALQLGYDAVDLENIDIDAILGDPAALENKRVIQPTAYRLKNQVVGEAPFEEANRASAKHSFAHGPGLVGGHCGERLQFLITAVTADGRICRTDTGDNRVVVQVVGLSLLSKAFPEPRPWIEDRRDGTYLVQFICATPGQYHVNMHVCGALLSMCPVTIEVAPGAASAFHSEISGAGVHACKIGEHTEFSIEARDEFGNRCGVGGHRFGVRAVGHVKLHEVADNEDGTYTVVYSVPDYTMGPVVLEVTLDGTPVKGSPAQPDIQRERVLGQFASKDAEDGSRHAAGAALEDHVQRLRFLHDTIPARVPELPHMDRLLPNGVAGLSGEDVAARVARRAQDEWQRLLEAREAMNRTRKALIEHQAALAAAGSAVHEQYMALKAHRFGIQAEKHDLDKVEDRLHLLRGGIMKRHQALTHKIVDNLADESMSPRSWSAGVRPDFDMGPMNFGLQEGSDLGGLSNKRIVGMGIGGNIGRPSSPIYKFEPAVDSCFGENRSRIPGGGVRGTYMVPERARVASPEELGQANRRLFHSFATRSISTGSKVNASGVGQRIGLGLQDFVRLAQAAQLQLPTSDLEDAFLRTVYRYGGSSSPDGEKALAFELFVELLVETARRRYGDMGDAEATAGLFEEYLLPLARQLGAHETA